MPLRNPEKADMLSTLIRLASELDRRGFFTAADAIDNVIASMVNDIAPPFSMEEVSIIADAIGIDISKSKFDLDAFRQGITVELEHGSKDPETDVIGKNYLAAGRIAWAHLKEDPEYYRKLAKIES
jgi:hypothetical protein